MPNWLGDGVMATPLLRALPQWIPSAAVTALARPLVQPALTGMPWVEQILDYPMHEGKIDIRATARMLAARKFNTAIILPNNWRSALIAWAAAIPIRLGYDRDGRRVLLTRHLKAKLRDPAELHAQLIQQQARLRLGASSHAFTPAPPQAEKKNDRFAEYIPPPRGLKKHLLRWHNFQPLSTIEYYLQILDLLDVPALPPAPAEGQNAAADGSTCGPADGSTRGSMPIKGYLVSRQMQLFLTTGEQSSAEKILQDHQVGGRYAILFPGANFGASKCWPAERFASLAQWLISQQPHAGWMLMLAGSPAEKPMLDAIYNQLTPLQRLRTIHLAALNAGAGVPLGVVKALVAKAGLVVCNDTGPRHFAAAFQRPLVTLFGPTDPRWAQTYDEQEQILRVPVECGPCQLKKCPIDHRCMLGITLDMVKVAVARAIEERRS